MRTNNDVPASTIHVPSSTIGIASSTVVLKKDNSSEAAASGFFGKSRPYKFWALAAILLLAFWSMFTGSVTLKWSTVDLTRFAGDTDSLIHDDLDILEVEERQKVVRHMWDVYTQSKSIRLPKFWQEAFEAAYELLVSETPGVRDAAVSEIAKMSMSSIGLHALPGHSQSTRRSRKSPKQVEKVKEEITIGSSESSR
ncbi:hypothetical protein I3760_15G072600 [Carya illinoinensis]|uniref:Uncharacterized protein n=1 Tax=Carya illinoinensis TaxID=32201 RepID=A0A8T1NCL4_CARIL|nr:uncharacterized protein LOC122297421 [Carya illinoinensis]KAG2666631.1 hypothetical protein I3760_15G072600 [Carya illinoinensis]KAG6626800.1 hypothetical protein CIPAW_15G077100 [Carya illinoinensis]KAG6674954.1 hypothetical protein I3842_15G073900 [Carya illinoinensis]